MICKKLLSTIIAASMLVSCAEETSSSNSSNENAPAGEQGPQGEAGKDGLDGLAGMSAYEIWLEAGNEGSVEDFINALT